MPYTWIDVDVNEDARAEVLRLNGGMRSVPTIVLPDGSILVEPSGHEVVAKLEELAL